MRKDIIVTHNFYENPDTVRDYALKQPFYAPYQPRHELETGRIKASWISTYYRKPSECPFKSSEALISQLENLVQERIDRQHWELGFPVDEKQELLPGYKSTERSCRWNCCFHVKYTQGKPGHGIHNHVTDVWNEVGELGWSGVLYLHPDPPITSGLTLWKHKHDNPYEWMTDKHRWEKIDELGNVYNRLILSRGWLPHSGGPGFGPTSESGRLFQTFFFKTLNPASNTGLKVI